MTFMTFMTGIGDVSEARIKVGWMLESPSGDTASGPRRQTPIVPTFYGRQSASIHSLHKKPNRARGAPRATEVCGNESFRHATITVKQFICNCCTRLLITCYLHFPFTFRQKKTLPSAISRDEGVA